jgi:hypothetical protein
MFKHRAARAGVREFSRHFTAAVCRAATTFAFVSAFFAFVCALSGDHQCTERRHHPDVDPVRDTRATHLRSTP